MKSHPLRAEPAELRVEEREDRMWTWCYVEPGTGVVLNSNDVYRTREAAAEAAQRAYPDLTVADGDDGDDGEGGEGGAAPST